MWRFLEALTAFDWLAFFRVGLQNLFRGEVNPWTFFVPLDSGWAMADIAELLQRHGVEAWGAAYAHGELFFRVRRRQAAWAQFVLQRAGVPLTGQLIDRPADHHPQRQGGAPTTQPQPAARSGPQGGAKRSDRLRDWLW